MAGCGRLGACFSRENASPLTGRVTMIIGEAFAKSWQRLWPWLERLRYADP